MASEDYRSAVSDGINMALFAPELAEATSIIQYSVGRVTVEIEQA
jgi:hypothetical protein